MPRVLRTLAMTTNFMSKYIITGGNKLSGTVRVSGNKNSVFPAFAAALLTEEEVALKNIPQIVDVEVSLQILKELGVKAQQEGDTIRLQAKKLHSHILPKELTRKLRGSVVFIGSILSRLKKVKFSHPGGDIIGKRSIDTHLEGLRQLGFAYTIDDLDYSCYQKVTPASKVEVFLDEASPTATQILILAAVLKKGATVLKNCAKEPQVVDLSQMLISMGAQIEGVGESTIKITGVDRLYRTTFTITSDYLEAVSFAIGAAITSGKITISNFNLKAMEPWLRPLEKMGLRFEENSEGVTTWAEGLKAYPNLKVNIWPGFPSDLMSLTIVLATQAKGVSLLHDWMYESRMFFVDKLIAMGANITIADPHRVVVYGPTKLHGRDLETPDIRAGIALVLAALVAKGDSVINRAELIERGYENVVEKLSSLGANIQIIK